MFIDPHVHCRDKDQSYKETIAHALSVAERAGFTAIFDIPNLTKPVTDRHGALERLEIAKQCKSPVKYGMYLLLTQNKDQVKEAVSVYNEFRPSKDAPVFIAGFKMFCGKSVGDCSVLHPDEQLKVYQALAEADYQGVVMTHCEKESCFSNELWTPSNPVSHAHSRPPESEVESVKDQIRLVKEAGFKGILHIGHISVPEAVEVVQEAKKSMRITCGVTPHHCVLSHHHLTGPQGLLFKMNPPLRTNDMAHAMLRLLLDGKIDWIETDHAPHALHEKLNPPYMSGVPGLPFYPSFIRMLKSMGASHALIHRVTFQNIADTFGLPFHQRATIPVYDLWQEYPFNPFQGVAPHHQVSRFLK